LALTTLSACATPPEVKTLSTAQIGYFDAAIKTVQIQSDALLAAADIIQQQAQAANAQVLEGVRQRTSVALARLDPNQPEPQRTATARALLNSATEPEQAAIAEMARLQSVRDAIRNKTQELQMALQQMKEVQIALDSYLQSEQVGESVTTAILGYPGVQNLLTRASAVMSAVSTQAGQLSQLVSQLKPMGQTR
jgi:hypothetical protein